MALSCGSSCFDAIDNGDDVRAGLTLDIHDDGGSVVHPRGLHRMFSAPSTTLATSCTSDRRAVAGTQSPSGP